MLKYKITPFKETKRGSEPESETAGKLELSDLEFKTAMSSMQGFNGKSRKHTKGE